MSRRNSHTGKALRRARRNNVVVSISSWCGRPEDSEPTMAATATELMERLGDRLQGEVRFIVEGGPRANRWLSQLRNPNETEEEAAHYRRIGALLREHGGVVITAIAEATPALPVKG